MKSRIKTEGVPRFVDDRSMWDEPFRPRDLRGLAKDMERQDAIARRLRLALPLEKRMNVLVIRPKKHLNRAARHRA